MWLNQRRQREDYSRFLSKGLVAHWPLLDLSKVYDISGRNPTPMTKGKILSLGSDYDGLSNTFDGVGGSSEQGGVISAGVSPHPGIAFSTASFSVAVWAKAPTAFGTAIPFLIGKVTTADKGWGLGLYTGAPHTGKPYFKVHDGSAFIDVAIQIAYNDDRWHLFVGVFDREDDVLRLSADAQPFVTSASTAAIGDISTQGVGNAGFNLGSRADNIGQFRNKYIGKIRNVRLWNRVLTTTDLQLLYQEKKFLRNPPYLLMDYEIAPIGEAGGFNRIISINT
jgi:hypothetical protein